MQNGQNDLEIKDKVGIFILSSFKIYCKATAINAVVTGIRKTFGSMEYNTESRNRHIIYSKLIFDKGAKDTQQRRLVFEQMALEQLEMHKGKQ